MKTMQEKAAADKAFVLQRTQDREFAAGEQKKPVDSLAERNEELPTSMNDTFATKMANLPRTTRP